MNFFRFQDPWMFLFLLIIPLAQLWSQRDKRPALHFPTLQRLKTLRAAGVGLLAAVPLILRCAAIVLLVVALARPQEGRKISEILSQGVDIILAIDTSGSMQALDFFKGRERVNRLEVVRDVVEEFVANRGSDRLGMVAFGSEAFTQCPLTLDHQVFLTFLDKLKIGMAGDSTAIGSAIGIAVKRLKDLNSQSKVIILLTDGRNNAGNIPPLQAAEIARAYGIKIYTIGVGTHGKAPFLVETFFGRRYVYQDVDLDEKTLKNIAGITGAKYFHAKDRVSLESIYRQIDQMEKTEVKIRDHSEYKELFHFFLIPAFVLLLLEITLSNTRLRRIP